jgi:hypothetical protein
MSTDNSGSNPEEKHEPRPMLSDPMRAPELRSFPDEYPRKELRLPAAKPFKSGWRVAVTLVVLIFLALVLLWVVWGR